MKVLSPPLPPLFIMVCFGLLHICNQTLLLSTCYSSLCLNGDESPLNIYLNNNIPWALYKLLYKVAFHKRPQTFFFSFIWTAFLLHRHAVGQHLLLPGLQTRSSESWCLLHRTYKPSPQIMPAATRVAGQSFSSHIVSVPGTQQVCNFQE